MNINDHISGGTGRQRGFNHIVFPKYNTGFGYDIRHTFGGECHIDGFSVNQHRKIGGYLNIDFLPVIKGGTKVGAGIGNIIQFNTLFFQKIGKRIGVGRNDGFIVING